MTVTCCVTRDVTRYVTPKRAATNAVSPDPLTCPDLHIYFKYSTSLRGDELARILTGTFRTINEAAS